VVGKYEPQMNPHTTTDPAAIADHMPRPYRYKRTVPRPGAIHGMASSAEMLPAICVLTRDSQSALRYPAAT
jgi:hypothetical protein